MEEKCRAHQAPVQLLLHLLPEADQQAYASMRKHFQIVINTHKHSGVTQFHKQLEAVHEFILRSVENQSLRSMLCGVFFGRGFILVNTARFKDLLYRSKSGMNNCFQKLKFDVMRPSNDIVRLFQELLPSVDQAAFNLNQWCVRLETEETKVRFTPTIPDSVACNFEIERIPSQRPLARDNQQIFTGPPEVLLNVKFLLNK